MCLILVEMLQEKASAVTDGCTSRVQTSVETDHLPDQSRLGHSTASSIPSPNEPEQVYTHTHAHEKYLYTKLKQMCKIEFELQKIYAYNAHENYTFPSPKDY